jgi:glucose/arabinose dehydrogenase
LNIVEKGKNYGWPIAVHGIDYPGAAIGQGITPTQGMEDPVYFWDPVIAPSRLAFYQGTLLPQWQKCLSALWERGCSIGSLENSAE